MVAARPPTAYPPQVCKPDTYDELDRSQMLIPASTA
jgi:hypothetical protein